MLATSAITVTLVRVRATSGCVGSRLFGIKTCNSFSIHQALHPNHQPTATPQTPHSPASPLRHSTTPPGTPFRLRNCNPNPSSTSNLSNSGLSKTGPSDCNNPSESREVDPSNTSKPQLTSESASNPNRSQIPQTIPYTPQNPLASRIDHAAAHHVIQLLAL